jgi:hypothetical protein
MALPYFYEYWRGSAAVGRRRKVSGRASRRHVVAGAISNLTQSAPPPIPRDGQCIALDGEIFAIPLQAVIRHGWVPPFPFGFAGGDFRGLDLCKVC